VASMWETRQSDGPRLPTAGAIHHSGPPISRSNWIFRDTACARIRWRPKRAHCGVGRPKRADKDEKQAEARQLKAQGMTYRDIAEALDVKPATLHRWLKEEHQGVP
jgi:hypothetical protein